MKRPGRYANRYGSNNGAKSSKEMSYLKGFRKARLIVERNETHGECVIKKPADPEKLAAYKASEEYKKLMEKRQKFPQFYPQN